MLGGSLIQIAVTIISRCLPESCRPREAPIPLRTIYSDERLHDKPTFLT
jgi:hypothetical protein